MAAAAIGLLLHINCPWAEECLPEGLVCSQHQIISSLIAAGFIPSTHPVQSRTWSLIGLHIPRCESGPCNRTCQNDSSMYPLPFSESEIEIITEKKPLTGASRQNYISISSVADEECVSIQVELRLLKPGNADFFFDPSCVFLLQLDFKSL